ncbi:MAG: tripartite tricarboxylate transporter substrate binding protein, partial [Delftia sp.]|nr:tripartite tricarboxylate transporter substrate binding protein [Delftia sp.]
MVWPIADSVLDSMGRALENGLHNPCHRSHDAFRRRQAMHSL